VKRELINLYREACLENPDAMVFLLAFHCYAHAVDDLVDEGCTPEKLLDCLAQANAMYGTLFWLANSARLGGVISQIANTWADSVAWEREDEEWKRRVADVIRQCGNDMVTQVASIVGGWRHMRSISLRLREHAYNEQHQEVTDGL